MSAICAVCRKPVDPKMTYCMCLVALDTKSCIVCASSIPKAARLCNQCKTPQTAWRHLGISQTTLAFLTALALAGASLCTQVSNYANRNSNTSVSVVAADDDHVYVMVSNTGRARSIIRKARLTFGENPPLQDAPLLLVTDDKVSARKSIPANSEFLLKFQVLGLEARAKEKRDDILARLPAGEATLEIDVEESTGEIVPRRDTFAAVEIRSVILNKLAGDSP